MSLAYKFSPAQLLMGRQIRNSVPVLRDLGRVHDLPDLVLLNKKGRCCVSLHDICAHKEFWDRIKDGVLCRRRVIA